VRLLLLVLREADNHAVCSASALARAGPGSLFIGYSAVGLLCYTVMGALGEMAAWLPLPSGFTGYATRFVDPALGFAMGWNYFFKVRTDRMGCLAHFPAINHGALANRTPQQYIIVTPNNLTAASIIMQYWISRETLNPGVWITVALVIIVTINYIGVKYFGEFEFWLR
jgi:amino acid transporter